MSKNVTKVSNKLENFRKKQEMLFYLNKFEINIYVKFCFSINETAHYKCRSKL